MGTRTERTRERLLTAAIEMFAERGYDGTSVAEIAARAGVTEMTFFRHFPTKASLLVDDPYDPLIGAAIGRQPSGLDAISRAARGVRSAWRELPEPSVEEVWVRIRIVAQTPTLRSTMAAGTAATEAVIADALTSDGADRRDARIAAAAVMAALNTALLDWSLTDSEGLGQAIDAALDVLEDRRA
jgi:AcrR family transcriptional regulator